MLENHSTANSDAGVWDMVKNRLPLLADTDANKKVLSLATLELMHEMEPYFGVGGWEKETPERIGDENFYTVLQRSLLADLAAIQVLFSLGAPDPSTAAGSGGGSAGGTFMGKVKAGSVEIEYEQFDSKKAGANAGGAMDVGTLFESLKKSAIRKGHQMGLIIDINGDTELAIEIVSDSGASALPFIIVSSDC